MSIGQTIKTIRKQRGLSQLALAIEADCTQATVHSIEVGKTNPRIGTLEKLVEAMGANLVITIEV